MTIKNKSFIRESLDFLYSERHKIESTGYRMDPDFRKTYRFINDEIQNLHMMLFELEYTEFSDRLIQLFEATPDFRKDGDTDVI